MVLQLNSLILLMSTPSSWKRIQQLSGWSLLCKMEVPRCPFLSYSVCLSYRSTCHLGRKAVRRWDTGPNFQIHLQIPLRSPAFGITGPPATLWVLSRVDLFISWNFGTLVCSFYNKWYFIPAAWEMGMIGADRHKELHPVSGRSLACVSFTQNGWFPSGDSAAAES